MTPVFPRYSSPGLPRIAIPQKHTDVHQGVAGLVEQLSYPLMRSIGEGMGRSFGHERCPFCVGDAITLDSLFGGFGGFGGFLALLAQEMAS